MHSNFCLFFPLGDAKQCFKSNELTSISFVNFAERKVCGRFAEEGWLAIPFSLCGQLIRPFNTFLSTTCTVNFLYSGHCSDLEVVSSLARVRNSGSSFQSNVCNLLLPGLAAVCIIGVSVIAGCPQGESWLYNFSSAFFDDFFWLFLFTCACSLLV